MTLNTTSLGLDLLVVHADGDAGLSVAKHLDRDPGVLHGYDANGDGVGDLYLGENGDPDSLYLSNGTELPDLATWFEPGNAYWEQGIASGDVTGDGRPDLALARQLYGEFLNRGGAAGPEGTPAWSASVTSSASDVAMTDFDGDGDLDVVFSESAFIGNGEGTLRVLAWNGTTLVPLWSTMMFGGITQMAWADIDGDGDDDAAFCADEQLRVYQRTGTLFTPIALDGAPLACRLVELGDYDADGDPDLALANDTLTIYANTAGSFAPVFTADSLVNAMAWGRCSPDTSPCFADAPTL